MRLLLVTLFLASPLAAHSADDQQTYRAQPAVLRSAPLIGEWIPDLAFTDGDSHERRRHYHQR